MASKSGEMSAFLGSATKQPAAQQVRTTPQSSAGSQSEMQKFLGSATGGMSGSTRHEIQPQKNTYSFTTLGGLQYSFDDSAADYMRKAYQANFGGYYGNDTEDQMNRANGFMPRSFANSYTGTKNDQTLYQMGLPSEKYIGKYLADYQEWLGDGAAYNLNEAAKDYVTSEWKKSWKYTSSLEDMQRQADGRMPEAVEESYYGKGKKASGITSSYENQFYLDNGLPPAASIGGYLQQYNDYLNGFNRVEQFYDAVSVKAMMSGEMQGIRNTDATFTIKGEDGEETTIKGTDFYKKIYYDTLDSDEWADIRQYIVAADKMPKELERKDRKDFASDTDYEDAVRAQAYAYEQGKYGIDKDDPYALRVSYADCVQHYLGENGFRQNAAKKRAAEVFGTEALGARISPYTTDTIGSDTTVGDVISGINAGEQAHAEALEQQQYDEASKSAKSAKAFVEEQVGSGKSADEILTSFADRGFSIKDLRKIKNALIKQKPDDDDWRKEVTESFKDVTEKAKQKEVQAEAEAAAAKIPEPIKVEDVIAGTAMAEDTESAHAYMRTLMDDAGFAEDSVDGENNVETLTGVVRKMFEAGASKYDVLEYFGKDKRGNANNYYVNDGEDGVPIYYADIVESVYGDTEYPTVGIAAGDMRVRKGIGTEDEVSWADDGAALISYADGGYRADDPRMRNGLIDNLVAGLDATLNQNDAEAYFDFQLSAAGDYFSETSAQNAARALKDLGVDRASAEKVISKYQFYRDGSAISGDDIIEAVYGVDAEADAVTGYEQKAADWKRENGVYEGSGFAAGVTEAAKWLNTDAYDASRMPALVDHLYSIGMSYDAIRNASETAIRDRYDYERETNKGVATFNLSDTLGALEDAITSAEQASMASELESFRQVAIENGFNDFEFNNAVMRMGGVYERVIPDDQFAQSYFIYGNGLRNYMSEEDQKMFDEMTPEEQQAFASELWASLPETGDENTLSRASFIEKFADTKMFNPDIHKSAGTNLESWVTRRAYTKLLSGLAYGAVSFADMATGVFRGDADQWEITKTLGAIYQQESNFGKQNSEQSYGALALNTGLDIADELLRMYTLNTMGAPLHNAASKYVNAINLARTNPNASLNVVQKGLAWLLNHGLNSKLLGDAIGSAPFIINASGNYFGEAMNEGATRTQATIYGTVMGLIEGITEQMTVDEMVGKGFGSQKLCESILRDGKNFANASFTNKLRGINMLAAFCGEFSEEFTSYWAGAAMKELTYARHDTFGEFVKDLSMKDALTDGLMGGLTGLIGAAIAAPSQSIKSSLFNYMENDGGFIFKTDSGEVLDYMAAYQVRDSLTPQQLERYRATASMMSASDYLTAAQNRSTAVINANRAKQIYDSKVKQINADYAHAVTTERGAIERANSAIDSLNKNGIASITQTEIGHALNSASTAINDATKAHAEKDAAIRTAQETYNATIKQIMQEYDAADEKINSHWVYLADLCDDLLGKLPAYTNPATSERLTQLRKETSKPIIDIISGETISEINLDSMDTKEQNELFSRDAYIQAVTNKILWNASMGKLHEIMSAARAGTLDEYYANVAAQERAQQEAANNAAAIEKQNNTPNIGAFNAYMERADAIQKAFDEMEERRKNGVSEEELANWYSRTLNEINAKYIDGMWLNDVNEIDYQLALREANSWFSDANRALETAYEAALRSDEKTNEELIAWHDAEMQRLRDEYEARRRSAAGEIGSAYQSYLTYLNGKEIVQATRARFAQQQEAAQEAAAWEALDKATTPDSQKTQQTTAEEATPAPAATETATAETTAPAEQETDEAPLPEAPPPIEEATLQGVPDGMQANEPKRKEQGKKQKAAKEKTSETKTEKKPKAERVKMSDTDKQRISELARIVGRNVVFDTEEATVDAPDDWNGFYDPKTNTIHIREMVELADADPKSPDFFKTGAGIVLFHELTHTLENSPIYSRLAPLVKEYIDNVHGNGYYQRNLALRMAKQKAIWDAKKIEYSTEALMERANHEVIAYYLQDVVNTEEFANRLAKDYSSAAARIKDWATHMLKQMNIRGKNDNAALALDHIKYLYMRALVSNGKKTSAGAKDYTYGDTPEYMIGHDNLVYLGRDAQGNYIKDRISNIADRAGIPYTRIGMNVHTVQYNPDKLSSTGLYTDYSGEALLFDDIDSRINYDMLVRLSNTNSSTALNKSKAVKLSSILKYSDNDAETDAGIWGIYGELGLNEVRVVFEKSDDYHDRASYEIGDNTIHIGIAEASMGYDRLYEDIMHETQHAIQAIEASYTGSSPEDAAQYAIMTAYKNVSNTPEYKAIRNVRGDSTPLRTKRDMVFAALAYLTYGKDMNAFNEERAKGFPTFAKDFREYSYNLYKAGIGEKEALFTQRAGEYKANDDETYERYLSDFEHLYDGSQIDVGGRDMFLRRGGVKIPSTSDVSLGRMFGEASSSLGTFQSMLDGKEYNYKLGGNFDYVAALRTYFYLGNDTDAANDALEEARHAQRPVNRRANSTAPQGTAAAKLLYLAGRDMSQLDEIKNQDKFDNFAIGSDIPLAFTNVGLFADDINVKGATRTQSTDASSTPEYMQAGDKAISAAEYWGHDYVFNGIWEVQNGNGERFAEFSDKDMTLNIDALEEAYHNGTPIKLFNAIKHDKLRLVYGVLFSNFNNGKSLEDVRVSFDEELNDEVLAVYNPNENLIALRFSELNKAETSGDFSNINRQILHEIQHAVQELERGAGGTSKEAVMMEKSTKVGFDMATSSEYARLPKNKRMAAFVYKLAWEACNGDFDRFKSMFQFGFDGLENELYKIASEGYRRNRGEYEARQTEMQYAKETGSPNPYERDAIYLGDDYKYQPDRSKVQDANRTDPDYESILSNYQSTLEYLFDVFDTKAFHDLEYSVKTGNASRMKSFIYEAITGDVDISTFADWYNVDPNTGELLRAKIIEPRHVDRAYFAGMSITDEQIAELNKYVDSIAKPKKKKASEKKQKKQQDYWYRDDYEYMISDRYNDSEVMDMQYADFANYFNSEFADNLGMDRLGDYGWTLSEQESMYKSLYNIYKDNIGIVQDFLENAEFYGKKPTAEEWIATVRDARNGGTNESVSTGKFINVKSGLTDDILYATLVAADAYYGAKAIVERIGALNAGYDIHSYHGTPSGGFTRFDPDYQIFGLYGNGFYFVDDFTIAESYAGKDNQYVAKTNSKTYSVLLKSPVEIDMDAQPTDAQKRMWRSMMNEFALALPNAHEDDFDFAARILGVSGGGEKLAEEIMNNPYKFYGDDYRGDMNIIAISFPSVASYIGLVKHIDDFFKKASPQETNQYFFVSIKYMKSALRDAVHQIGFEHSFNQCMDVLESAYNDVLGQHLNLDKKSDDTDEENALGEFIKARLKSQKYTGITHQVFGEYNVSSLDVDYHTVHIVFDPEQIKSADPFTVDDNGALILPSERFNVDNQDIRWMTSNSDYDEDIRKYGVIGAGMNPREDIPVPRKTGDAEYVSKVARTMMETYGLPDGIRDALRDFIAAGGMSHPIVTKDAQVASARSRIAELGGITYAAERFKGEVDSQRYTPLTVATGIALLQEYQEMGDAYGYIDIATHLMPLATEAGRMVDLFKVIKGLSGVGAGVYWSKFVNKLNADYADAIARGRMKKIDLNSAELKPLVDAVVKAKSRYELARAEDNLTRALGAMLPLSFSEKIRNWRFMSMLTNPVTHMRNIMGNIVMGAGRMAKDAVATGIEAAAKATGVIGQDERAHSVRANVDGAYIAAAEISFQNNYRDIFGESRYGIRQTMDRYKRSFDNKALNKVAEANSLALEREDEWFLKSAYIDAYSKFCQVRGYDPKNISGEDHMAAHEWAKQQAQKATFHDASAFASWINRMPNVTLGERVAHGVVDAVMPFVKTPINIAKRGVEYSPAGIIAGVYEGYEYLKNRNKDGGSKYSAAQAIDKLSSGLVGTALTALGVLLAKAGILRAGKDDEKSTYEEALGDQPFSMMLGDLSFDLSGIAPMTIPLFMGVAWYENSSADGEEMQLEDFLGVLAGITNPLTEMSFLSSLNSALESYAQNGIGGATGQLLMESGKQYLSQFLPTIGSKIATMTDAYERTTKASATSPLGTNLDYYWRSLVKKVPGLSRVLEKSVDVKGEEIKKTSFGDWALAFANSFILPAKIKVRNRDEIDDSLIDLYLKTGNTNIFPEAPSRKYFTSKGVKYPMNAEQFQEYSAQLGQAYYANLADLYGTSSWDKLSDEEKAEQIEDALDSAKKTVDNIWKELLGVGVNE